LLEDSLEERMEKTGGFLSDSEKTEGETKEGDMDENKVECSSKARFSSILALCGFHIHMLIIHAYF
jgi:transcription initiation factor TFIID subunit 5